MAGISREHLNRIEAGKVTLTDDMQEKLMEAVEKFNPDAPMFLLFDYGYDATEKQCNRKYYRQKSGAGTQGR